MSNKPNISESATREILRSNKVTDKVCMVGIRGYYLDSIGKKGENDRNVYDDCIIVISPRRYETFRGNTDPSVYRKGIATMKTGVHRYYKGLHKILYWALRLVGEQVPVTRDGELGDKTGIALNIHKGGFRGTGSEGCQTLHPNDWDDFIELVYDEMDFYGQKTIPYVLIDEKERRLGKYKMPHLLTLDDREIDNLLIRFDNDFEPTAPKIDSNSAKPSTSTATVQSSESVESPNVTSSLPQQTQSVQDNLEKGEIVVNQFQLPKIGSYIQEIGGKIAENRETIEKTKQSFDYLQEIASSMKDAKDGAKSLWMTISQIFFHVIWAIFGFFIGLPIEVWIVVSVLVAIVGIYFLYRQIKLGQLREVTKQKFIEKS